MQEKNEKMNLEDVVNAVRENMLQTSLFTCAMLKDEKASEFKVESKDSVIDMVLTTKVHDDIIVNASYDVQMRKIRNVLKKTKKVFGFTYRVKEKNNSEFKNLRVKINVSGASYEAKD